MAKVLIEFFSQKTNENILSVLNGRFEKVCFLYSSPQGAPSAVKKDALTSLVKKLFGIAPAFYEIRGLSIGAALASLHKLWNEGDKYFIDITGGDEAFIAAAGLFSSQRGTENVTIHQYDVFTGEKRLCYPPCEETGDFFPHYISAEDLLALNGCIPLEKPAYYSFSDGVLKKEVLRLWEAIKTRPKEWNKFCALDRDPDEENRSLNQRELLHGDEGRSFQSIFTRLKNIGIFSDEKVIRLGNRDYMRFSINVPDEALFLYDKAGTVLEMYGALCAHESGLFHDVRVGVKLDWDGILAHGQMPNPYNEIDLVLMKNNLPIFVSCKNMIPKNDHLYEITVMAKHYGGHFATPALFCSENATEGFKKRAEEMGVVLIDGIRAKTRETMVAVLEKKFGKN